MEKRADKNHTSLQSRIKEARNARVISISRTYLHGEHLAYEDPRQQSNTDMRREGGAYHEGGRYPGVFLAVQVIRVVQVTVNSGEEEAQAGAADWQESQYASPHEGNCHHADQSAD